MRLARLPILAPALLLFIGCGDTAPETERATTGDHDLAATTDHDQDHGHDHGHDHADGEPMSFLVIMQRLGADMTALTHGLWIEDYASMSERAASIASHPPIVAADTERIREILGHEYEAFNQADHDVHVASEALHRAVEARDLDAILGRLADVQRGCVACHSGYRDRLLTEGSTIPRQ